jgi:cytoskeletal protein RodZ
MSNPQRKSNRQGGASRSGGGEAASGAGANAAQSRSGNAEGEGKPQTMRIGDTLKREREKRGDDLAQIADFLCIRRNFLESIENNRYDELPADAYVIGFLRTYAAFLGLDGADAIDRYRKEMSGRRRRPELSVPTPITEGRTPSVAIMVSACVAALLIYALWYGLSISDRAEVTTPPPLPVAAAPTTPAVPASTTAPAAQSETPTVPLAPEATTATSAPTALTAPANPSSIQLNGAAPAIAPIAPAAASAETASADKTAAASPAIPSPAVSAADAAKATATDASQKATNTYGDTGPDSRISVRAEKESWILIADDKGHTLFDKVLKPGDVYRVPDDDGLTLTAGNGNGIILSVDGTDIPKLAGSSSVLRGVALDPDDLKSPR